MPRRLTDPQRLALRDHVCPKCGERDRIGADHRGLFGWVLRCLRCGHTAMLDKPVTRPRK